MKREVKPKLDSAYFHPSRCRFQTCALTSYCTWIVTVPGFLICVLLSVSSGSGLRGGGEATHRNQKHNANCPILIIIMPNVFEHGGSWPLSRSIVLGLWLGEGLVHCNLQWILTIDGSPSSLFIVSISYFHISYLEDRLPINQHSLK